MKKHFVYALLSAIALTGAVGLTSCVDKEEGPDLSKEFDQHQREVFTDFVFNVSLGNGTTTRMSAANTQFNGTTFRGITNANILTFFQGVSNRKEQKTDDENHPLWYTDATEKEKGEAAGATTTVDKGDDLKVMIDVPNIAYDGRWITPTTKDAADAGKRITASRVFDLNALIGENELKADDNTSSTKSRRVVQIALPTFTNTIMFYGKAARSKGQTDEEVGHTDMHISNDLSYSYNSSTGESSGTYMDAKVRIVKGSEASDSMHAQERLISFVLKRIVQMGLQKEYDHDVTGDEANAGKSGVEGRWNSAVGRPFDTSNNETYDLKHRDLRYMHWLNDKTPQIVKEKAFVNPTEDEEIDFKNFVLFTSVGTHVVDDVTYTISQTDLANGATQKNCNVSFTDAGGSPQSASCALIIEKEITWKDYGTNSVSPYNGEAMKPLEEILKNAYEKFTTIGSSEFRAGAGFSVADVMNDLYIIFKNVSEANPTTQQEVVAKAFTTRLMRRFNAYFNGGEYDSQGKYIPLTFKTSLECYEELVKHVNLVGATLQTSSTPLTSIQVGIIAGLTGKHLNIQDFPENQHLPAGSARLLYDGTKNVFYYDSEQIPSGDIGTSHASIHEYIYPAELMYFGNSGVRVSDGTFSVADYPDGTDDWMSDAIWDGKKDSNNKGWSRCDHVTSSTRAVAMQNNINYGTALLKTSVRYGVKDLKDNNKALNKGEEDNVIDSSISPFILTGVLVGGQPNKVGWDYLPIENSSNLKYLLWDSEMPNTSSSYPGIKYLPIAQYTVTAPTDFNYTMVYDNYDSSVKSNGQQPVYVALEFLNTGEDFWGMHNLVSKGGKFYIIGKLDPSTVSFDGGVASAANDKITWPTTPTVPTTTVPSPATVATDYALPPYYVSGQTNTDDDPYNTYTEGSTVKSHRVFIQDYVTEANFVIGEKSLQKAYLTVPDLRSAQVSLGLSVDLKWEKGLQFDNIELGK